MEKKMVKIVTRKAITLEYISVLELERDYLLGSLYDAMVNKNTKEKRDCKKRLKEIHKEIAKLEKSIA